MPKTNHWKRKNHELLLRQLSFEVDKKPFTDDLSDLPHKYILFLINQKLIKLGLIPYTKRELTKRLTTKN